MVKTIKSLELTFMLHIHSRIKVFISLKYDATLSVCFEILVSSQSCTGIDQATYAKQDIIKLCNFILQSLLKGTTLKLAYWYTVVLLEFVSRELNLRRLAAISTLENQFNDWYN